MTKDTMTLEAWFKELSTRLGLHNDINHPTNREYDYVAAYYGGVKIPEEGEMLPSEFKDALSKTRFIKLTNSDEGQEYYDSKTGQVTGPQDFIVQDIKRENKLDNFLENEVE